MSVINVLDKKVYNRISAGEVVERPASVVKELVENSLDAGATVITVSIESGGVASIKVTDNGSGLERDQLKKAFLPHATSKIAVAEDLDSVMTLGFRGEALASIGAVARCTFASKTADLEIGAAIDCDGGELSDVYDFPVETGTIFVCRELFYNTPARSKFLKSVKSEEGEVESLILRMALSRPNVSFKLICDGKSKIETFGGGLQDCIASVYGTKTLENCFRVEQIKNGIRVSGYVGKLSFTKPTRAYQTLIVNGRYVTDSTVSAAVTNAYGSYLMKRQYPFYVLMLDVPPQIVDVNVHPRKAEVRFSDNQLIYGAVYSTVSKVLDGTSSALDIIKDDGESFAPPQPRNFDNLQNADKPLSNVLIGDKSGVAVSDDSGLDKGSFGNGLGGGLDYSGFNNGANGGLNSGDLNNADSREDKGAQDFAAQGFRDYKGSQSFDGGLGGYKKVGSDRSSIDSLFSGVGGKGFSYAASGRVSVCDPLFGGETDGNPDDIFAENKKYAEKLEAEKKARQESIQVEQSMIFVGQAFNTYLIFQYGDDLYLIDQHAAHERLLYDSLCEKVKRGMADTQMLLLPYVFKTSPEDFDKIYRRFTYFRELGIEIDNVGDDTFKVSALPCELCSINIREFFDDLLHDNEFKTEEIPLTLKEKLMQTACKHAIKGGDSLDRSEIDALMAKLKGNFGLRCPHGRPICVKVGKVEIEKWFKRIL